MKTPVDSRESDSRESGSRESGSRESGSRKTGSRGTDSRGTAPLGDGAVPAYVAVQRTAAFARLRSRSRRYVAAMTVLFLGVFLVTALLAGWAPSAFARPVGGHVNVGMLCALGLILLPALISVVHLRYARHRLDPLAERIRGDFERRRQ